MKNKPEVSIVVAVYNAENRIAKVFDALSKQEYKRPYEIILVDDGSTDKSLEIMRSIATKCNAKKFQKSSVYVFTKKNGGASAARNFGIKKSSGKYIVITDDDVVLEKQWLKKTIPLLDDGNVGWVSSIIKNNLPEDMNYLDKLLFDYAMASRDANIKNEGFLVMCNATRREIFDKVGLYDEVFDLSGVSADIDLVIRIKDKKYVMKISQAIGVHLESKERFNIIFNIKKPFQWAKYHAMLLSKKRFSRLSHWEIILVLPSGICIISVGVILSIINIYFASLFVLVFFAFLYFRGRMIKRLLERKRNIFEIFGIFILEFIRVLSYNLGALKYFLFGKN